MPQNDKFEWLTYETIFQQQRFARTNEKLDIGLYAIQRNAVTVFFRSNLSDELLDRLTDAFFPDVDNAKTHREDSDRDWPWKQQAAVAVAMPVSPVAVPLAVSAAVHRLHLPPYVVLPYNHLDNDLTSRALGTDVSPLLKQLDPNKVKWQFWKTASRSCVMRTSRVKNPPDSWVGIEQPWKAWEFAEGKTLRENFRFPSNPPTEGYVVKKKQPCDFSVKTGVIFVGSENQKNAEKDNLDSNWVIACLRSDHVAEIDKSMAGNARLEDLVVLTELLSINERTTRGEGNLDGVQVRDLTPLNKDNIYIPPLSIPVIDKDFQTRSSEFVHLTDNDWCEFWKRAWAGPLGRAKALFALRYGLQHLNPNVQNYLIEFESGGATPKPTGRIVIRDLQDASLQREVIWALYGTGGPPPTVKSQLANLTSDILKHEFTPALINESQETGTTDKKFGAVGLQFLWKRFSMFGGNGKHEEFVERMFREGHNETFDKIAAAELAELAVAKSPINAWPESEFQKYDDYADLPDDQSRTNVRLYAANMENPAELKRLIPNLMVRTRTKSTVDAIIGKINPRIAAKEVSVQKRVQRRLLYVMADWGRLHNLAYIHCVQESLGVNFNIDWKKLPSPVRHLDADNVNAMDERDWEEEAAKVLHDYIASDEGQNKVRAYRARKWEPAHRIFGLQLLDENEIPIELSPVKFHCDVSGQKKVWIDLTDRRGFVNVYEGAPDDYQFEIMGFRDLAGGSFSVGDVRQKASGPILDFGYAKIKYVT
jgi:hypothetical protein